MSNLAASADSIIKKSIFSSIYIDDQIFEPYDNCDVNDPQFSIPKGVYESFRKEKKSIDFYRFDPINKNWEDDADYLFKNRDMLVLDWQLVGADMSQHETLKILKRAIFTDSLHFISIYTAATQARDFPEIFYQIKAFFNRSYTDESAKIYTELIASLDDEGIEESFFESIGGQFKDLALTAGAKKKDVYNDLKSVIQNRLGQQYQTFAKAIRKIDANPDIACEVFGYLVNKVTNKHVWESENEIRIDFVSDNFIVVNHTIIQITAKSAPKPEELFQFFTKAIQKITGNLLTLVALEIRSLLRESSGFIGKDADLIKDEVLFHQKDLKHGFLEFLMSIVKSHTISYFDYKQSKLESMNDEFWQQYYEEKHLSEKTEFLKKDENNAALVDELLKLNIYYNILHINRADGDIVKFGDVFFRAETGSYYMCITAHCDCLQPENIYNNFYFVSGNSHDPKTIVGEGDDVFCSYLKQKNKIVAIKWNSKPVVLRLPDNMINGNKVKGLDGKDVEYVLEYHSTVKENYTQRMANNAFSHAMRVGIDFAKLKAK